MSSTGGGRVPGGVGRPEPTTDSLPPLSRAGSLVVGVIDTGIVLDKRGRPPAWFGRHLSFCADEDADTPAYPRGERLPSDGHGTFVAGLVLREAPTARVRMWGVLAKARVPVSGDEASDRDDKAVAGALAALAINPYVQVVNLSFGDLADEAETTRRNDLAAAVASFRAARPDVAIVASAGNQDTTDKFYPAALEDVVSVGAVDETGFFTGLEPDGLPGLPAGATALIASFSNKGDWVRAFARGVDVLGPLPESGSRWARWKGTSFAAAVVSGRIAQVAIELGMTGMEAQDVVLKGSEKLPDRTGVWVHSVDSPNRVATT